MRRAKESTINESATSEQEPEYAAWLRQMHAPAHARRTAERNAAFFLPHIKPGIRLLDIGCGPGSITLGLAARVAPGEAVGVDASEEAIASARRRAEEQASANARFETADAYALPFDDGTFDAAFMHAVLQHLRDPLAALREAHRVLKPGGVIGVADADHDGTIIAPEDPLLWRSFAVADEVRQIRGGDVRVGKRLRALLHEAGFERSVGSVSAGADGTAEAVQWVGESQAQYHAAPAYVDYVVERGISTKEEMRAISDAWRRWGADPGAFWARFWCEAVGAR